MSTPKKRSDGRFYARIYLGRNSDGKKVFKHIYGQSAAEVKQQEAHLRLLYTKGVDLTSLNDTFGQWFERTKAAKEPLLSPGEYNTFIARAGLFQEELGAMPLKDIQQSHLQTIINDLAAENPHTGKPSGKRTLERYLRAAYAVFECAVEHRATDFNPCKYVSIPKKAPKKARRALTAEEQKRVETLLHPAQLPAMLMMYSGLRLGEVTALLWSDVDLLNSTISVTKSFDFKQNRIKQPKTESGTRLVSIPDKLTRYLSAVKRESIYVVTNPASGGMMTDKAWRTLWKSYMKAMSDAFGEKQTTETGAVVCISVEPFTPHYLRHTFCTLMYLAGVDVLTAKEQLGHSDIRTTLEIYTHLDAIYKKNNVRKLNDYLSTNTG